MSNRQGKFGSKRDQAIHEQRKKLEQLRLQTQSQNTKLLKIQQKERQVEAQYLSQKKNMQETLAKLALQQEKFMNKQMQTTEQFQRQKQQIFANDRKKQSYSKQKDQLQIRNTQRREQIKQKQQKLRAKKLYLDQLRQTIKKYMIYQQFLRDVKNLSDDFGSSDQDQFSVMSILQRYRTMQKKKKELADVHRKIGLQKQSRLKSIQQLKKMKETYSYEFSLRIKQLKERCDNYNQQNLQLQSQLQGQLNENVQKQRQFGQVIFSIRGLYLSIAGQDKQDKQNKNIIEMLSCIQQQRRKLREYLDLFQRKVQEGKKIDKKDNQ